MTTSERLARVRKAIANYKLVPNVTENNANMWRSDMHSAVMHDLEPLLDELEKAALDDDLADENESLEGQVTSLETQVEELKERIRELEAMQILGHP